MAYLQSDIPPSTAPVMSARTAAPHRLVAPAHKPGSKLSVRVLFGLAAAALFAIPGYMAATATESLAIGILTADLAFLIVVAGWSSVAGGARR